MIPNSGNYFCQNAHVIKVLTAIAKSWSSSPIQLK